MTLLWPGPGTARELRLRAFGGHRPALGVRTTASSPEPLPVAGSLPIPLGPSASWSSLLKARKGLNPGADSVCPPENPRPSTPSCPHSAEHMRLKRRLTLGRVRDYDQGQQGTVRDLRSLESLTVVPSAARAEAAPNSVGFGPPATLCLWEALSGLVFPNGVRHKALIPPEIPKKAT